MQYKSNFGSFENKVKMFDFDPKFRLGFHNLFNLFPVKLRHFLVKIYLNYGFKYS